MICKNCGAQLPDGVAFCTNCGTAVEAPQQEPQPQPQPQPAQPAYQQPAYQQPVYQQPQPVYQQPMYAQPVAGEQPNILVLGILSVAFLGGFFTSLVGMILGIVGRKKGKAYIAQGGTLTGKSKVGFILSKLGFIFGLIETIGVVIYIIVMIIAAIAGTATSYSYY